MANIDERIVKMIFDNKDFEKGVSESTKSLENLKKSLELDKSVKSLESLDETVKGFDFGGLSDGIANISDKFSALGILGVTAMERVANAAIDAGIKMAKSISIDQISAGKTKYETETKAVQTITNATGKSVKEVEKVLSDLMKYTDETSYDFSTMVESIGKFTSVGVDLKIAEKAMEGIANEAAKSGAGIGEANRAMYNFAQALSAGAVKLIDWKSIENANMATKEFKEQLVSTAIEMGTLTKKGDSVGSVIKKSGTSIKETEVNYKSFNETLSEGWLTSDVLIKTLAKYSDTSTEFGLAAFHAAQEALTFTDALNAVKDAVSSGWSRTFKALFGNLDESRELWTKVANSLYDFAAIFFEARNNLLEGWHELGGYNSAVEAASNIWHTFMNVVRMLKDTLENVFPPVTAERLAEATDKVKEASEKIRNLFGWNEETEVEKSFTRVIDYAKELNEVITKGDRSDAVKSLQEQLIGAGYALDKHGADGIFGPETEEAVKKLQRALGVDVTGAWDEATRQAAMSKEVFQEIEEYTDTVTEKTSTTSVVMKHLSDILEGVLSVIAVIKSAISTGAQIIGHFFSLFKPFISPILDLLAIFGRMASNFRTRLEVFNVFGNALDDAKKKLKPFGDAIKIAAVHFQGFLDQYKYWAKKYNKNSFGDFLKYTYNQFKKTEIGKIVDEFVEKVSPAVKKITEFFKTVKDAVVGFFTADVSGSNGFIDSLKKRLEPFKDVWEWIKTNIGGLFKPGDGGGDALVNPVTDFFKTVGEKIKSIIDFLKTIDIAQLALFAVTIIGAIKVYKKIKAPLEAAQKIAEIPKQISNTLKRKNATEWLDSIGEFAKNFGIGIGLLAASVYVIAQLDSGKAWGATAVIGALTAIVVAAAAVMKKLKLDGINTKGFVTFTATVVVLAEVAKKLSKLSTEELIKGLGGLTLILIEIVAFANAMKDNKLQVGGITDLGAGIGMIVSAISTLGKLDTVTLLKGLGGLTVVMIELAAFMRLTNGTEFKTGPLAMVGVGTALLMMSVSLKILAKLEWEDMVRGLVGLGAVMLELAAFMRLTSGFGSSKHFLGMVGIGAAVYLLAKSLEVIAGIETDGIVKGIIGLGAIMTELAIFMKLVESNNPLKQVASAISLVGIGAALLLFVQSVKFLGELDTATIVKGVIGLAAVMTEIVIFMKLIDGSSPLSMLANCVTLIGIGASLNLFVLAIAGLSLIDGVGILKGVVAIGAILTEIAIFLRLSSGTTHDLKSLPMMITMAGSLLVFALALSAIADVPWENIIAFGVSFGIVMNSLASTIAILSAIPISAGLTAIANLDLFIANLMLVLAAIAGVEELTNGGLSSWLEKGAQVLGKAIGGFIKGIVSPFIDSDKNGAGRKDANSLTDYLNDFIGEMSAVMDNMAPFLEKVKMIDEDSVKGVDNLVKVLLKMTGTELLDTMANWIVGDESGSAFVAFAKDLVALMPHLKNFAYEAEQIKAESVKKGVDILDSFGKVAEAVIPMSKAAVVDAINAFISNIVSSGGDSAFINFAKNLVTLMPEVKKFSNEADSINAKSVGKGVDILKNFGSLAEAVIPMSDASVKDAINTFVSTIFGGSNESGYITFAKDMVDLMPQIKKFANGVKGIDAKTVETGVAIVENFGSVAKAVIPMSEASLVNAIGSFVTTLFSGSDEPGFITFAKQLAGLIPPIKDFATKASGIDNKQIKAAGVVLTSFGTVCEAAKKIAWNSFVTNIASFLSGNNSIVSFVDDMITLSPKLFTYGHLVKGVDNEAIKSSAASLKAMAEVANEIPATDGLFQKIFGEHDIEGFGTKLKSLGEGLKSFYDSTKDIPASYSAKGYTEALTGLVGVAEKIPKAGGLVQKMLGEQDLGSFGDKLKPLGEGLSNFYNSTKDISSDYSAAGAVNALQALADLENSLVAHGGLSQWFSGEKDLGTFAEKVDDIGGNLASFSTKIESVKAYKMKQVAEGLSKLVEVVAMTPDQNSLMVNFQGLQWLIDALGENIDFTSIEQLGENIALNIDSGIVAKKEDVTSTVTGLIGDLKDEAGNYNDDFEDKGKSIISSLKDGINYDISSITTIIEDLMGGISGTIADEIDIIESNSESICSAIADGIRYNNYYPEDEIVELCENLASALNDYYDNFEDAGEYIDRGIEEGLYNNSSYVSSAARDVAYDAYMAACDELGIASPAKKGAWIGEMFDRGLSRGLKSYENVVGKDSRNVSKSVVNNAMIGVRGLADVIADGIDDSPVIRPVLDLSQIREQSGELESLFGGTPTSTMRLMASLSSDKARGLTSRGIQNEIGMFRSSMSQNDSNFNKMFSDFSEKFDRLENDIKNLKVVLNDGTLVGKILPAIDRGLGKRSFIDSRSR